MISRLISVAAWWNVVNQVCLSFVVVCLICVDLERHVVNHYDCFFSAVSWCMMSMTVVVSLIFGTSFIVEIAFISFCFMIANC